MKKNLLLPVYKRIGQQQQQKIQKCLQNNSAGKELLFSSLSHSTTQTHLNLDEKYTNIFGEVIKN